MKTNILFTCFFSLTTVACAAMPTQRSQTTARIRYVPVTTPSVETIDPFRGQPDTLDPFAASERQERKRAMLPKMAPIGEVGFVYRPPSGFERDNPRSHTIVNDTTLSARIFMDGREMKQVVSGTVLRAPVMYNGAVRFIPLLPPDAKLFQVGDTDRHTIIVELYAGPAPLLYAMTCQIEVNFLKQQLVTLSYRPCHKTNPSP